MIRLHNLRKRMVPWFRTRKMLPDGGPLLFIAALWTYFVKVSVFNSGEGPPPSWGLNLGGPFPSFQKQRGMIKKPASRNDVWKPVFFHTFGNPSDTVKNHYHSTLAVFPLNWAYKNCANNGPCNLRRGFPGVWGRVFPSIDFFILRWICGNVRPP